MSPQPLRVLARSVALLASASLRAGVAGPAVAIRAKVARTERISAQGPQQPSIRCRFDVPPITSNNPLPNVSVTHTLLVQLPGKESLFNADQATCGVIIAVAVNQAPMAGGPIAVAKTWLLSQYSGDLFSHLISFSRRTLPE